MADFRGASQDVKRAATHKAKWAYSLDARIATISPKPAGRDGAHPRPIRAHDFIPPRHAKRVDTSKMLHAKRDQSGKSVSGTGAISRKLPGLSADDSASSADEDYDAPILEKSEILGVDSMPSSGSQVLNAALAKAIEVYEDKETTKLVKNEWSVLDDDGEELGLSPARKGKTKKETATFIDDEDYELV